jgi:hypothetical protein
VLSDLEVHAQDATRVNRFTDAIPTSRDECLLSPSGNLLAVPWYEHQRLYQIDDEQVTLLATFGGADDLPCAFSRDESKLITSNSFEGTGGLVWDLTSTPPAATPIELDCDPNIIRAVDGSDDYVVNGRVDGREVYHLLNADCRLKARIRVDEHFWQAEDFAAIAIGENKSRILIAVTGARDDIGGQFASIGRPQCIQLLAYDIDDDELHLIEREIDMNSYVREMGFRSDGRELIAVTDYTIYRLYLDAEGNVEDISIAPNGGGNVSQLETVEVGVIGSAIIPASGALVLQRSPEYELRWLEAEYETSTGWEGASSPLFLQTSHDGSVLVGTTWTDEPRVHVWTRQGHIMGSDDIGTVSNIEFSPSGSRFAIEGERGIVLGTVNDGFPAIVDRLWDVRSIRFLEETRIGYVGTYETLDGPQPEMIERDFREGSQEQVLRPGEEETQADPLAPTDRIAPYGKTGWVRVTHRVQMPTPWNVDFHDSVNSPAEVVPLEMPLEDFWISGFIATDATGSRAAVCLSARELIEIRRGPVTEDVAAEVVRHPIDYTIDAMAYSPQGWLMTVDREGYVRIHE